MSFGRVAFIFSMIIVAGTAFLVWSGYDFLTQEFPDVSVLRNQYPVVEYHSTDKTSQIKLQPAPPTGWVGLESVSKTAVGAIIVSEDWAFFQHKGYDPNQIREAIKDDWALGKLHRGASTITQQVVKNVFLDNDKNLWRKAKELVLAVRLENSVPKKKILETYLNVAEWGDGIYGINAASQHYFKKAPSELTAREGAFLAMLLPSPKRYNQSFKSRQMSEYANKTVKSILTKMESAKYITEEQLKEDLNARYWFENEGVPGSTTITEEVGTSAPAETATEEIQTQKKPPFPPPVPPEDAVDPHPETPGAPVSL